MKLDTQMALRARTYEMHNGEWQEVEPQSNTHTWSLLRGSLWRGLAALFATAFAVAAIAVIGIVATVVALVLCPLALLAVWALRAFNVQGMKKGRSP
jgi:hypothetical protein